MLSQFMGFIFLTKTLREGANSLVMLLSRNTMVGPEGSGSVWHVLACCKEGIKMLGEWER